MLTGSTAHLSFYRKEAPYLILNDYVFPDGSFGYAFLAGTSSTTS